jgi:hypothetical protein
VIDLLRVFSFRKYLPTLRPTRVKNNSANNAGKLVIFTAVGDSEETVGKQLPGIFITVTKITQWVTSGLGQGKTVFQPGF